MPRQTIEQALQQRTTINPTTQPRAGFDPVKYQSAMAAATPVVATQADGGTRTGNFLAGAFDAFTAPGRTIQKGLSKAVDSLTGSRGFGAPNMDRDSRISDLGANPDATSTKVGEFAGKTATFLSPGGLQKGAANLAFQGGRSFTMESLNQGKVDGSSVAAGVTDAVAIPVANQVFKIGGDVLKGIAGGLSAKGRETIEAALQRPGAAFKAAGGDATEGLKELSQQVRAGVRGLRKSAGDEYAQLLSEASISTLPRKTVVDKVSNAIIESADVAVSKGKLVFNNTPLTDVEERQLSKLFNRVTDWDDFTPAGINRLATTISRFRRGGADSQNFDRIVDTVRRSVRETAGDVAPTIREANLRFSDKMDLIDEIDNVIKTGGGLGQREGIRKTAEALGRLFNSNKQLSREVIEDLERALNIDILGTMAGQQLTDVAPRSTSAIGGALDTAIQSVSSPVLRNALPLVGAIQTQLVDRVMGIPGIPESARATIVQTITEITNQIEDASN